jgi:hypothetical protein
MHCDFNFFPLKLRHIENSLSLFAKINRTAEESMNTSPSNNQVPALGKTAQIPENGLLGW